MLCDEIISAADSVLTNGSAIAMSTVPITFYNKKVRYKMNCCILRTVLVVVILLFLIAIICYQCTKQSSKQKIYWRKIMEEHWKLKIMEEKEKWKKKEIFCTKNCTCYYFDDIIKFEEFNFDNILIDEKSYENILIYDVLNRTFVGTKSLRFRVNKMSGFIGIYIMELDI